MIGGIFGGIKNVMDDCVEGEMIFNCSAFAKNNYCKDHNRLLFDTIKCRTSTKN
jgi:hypothetical protein